MLYRLSLAPFRVWKNKNKRLISIRPFAAALVGRRKPEPESFEKAFLKFQKPIFRYVLEKVKNRDVAEELTQEVFLKAHRFQDSYDPSYAFSTWIWTIARNTVSDHFRKWSQEGALQKDSEGSPLDLEQIPCSSLNPELALIEASRRQALLQLIGNLTELQKKALFMRLIHQLSYEEIARRLNLSLSSVKSLIYRAKGALVGDAGDAILNLSKI